jgi:hypothetical protein
MHHTINHVTTTAVFIKKTSGECPSIDMNKAVEQFMHLKKWTQPVRDDSDGDDRDRDGND